MSTLRFKKFEFQVDLDIVFSVEIISFALGNFHICQKYIFCGRYVCVAAATSVFSAMELILFGDSEHVVHA